MYIGAKNAARQGGENFWTNFLWIRENPEKKHCPTSLPVPVTEGKNSMKGKSMFRLD